LELDLWVVDFEQQNRYLLHSWRPTQLFLEQFLPFFDQYALSHLIWSPTSDALVLPVQLDEASHITVVPLGQTPSRVLDSGAMPAWSQF
jgi:TolB protein